MKVTGTNTGHGHVWPRPDGIKMRCGGPSICKECARDLGLWLAENMPAAPTPPAPSCDKQSALTEADVRRIVREEIALFDLTGILP